jgi:hypothetical protein
MVLTGNKSTFLNYSDFSPSYLFDIVIPMDYNGLVLDTIMIPINDANGPLFHVSGTFNLQKNGSNISTITITNDFSLNFTSVNTSVVAGDVLTLTTTSVSSQSGDGHQFYLASPPANNFSTFSSLLYADLTFISPTPAPAPCLTSNCNILTPSGYKNVSQLNQGDKIITSTGKTKNILKIIKTESNNPTYLIKKDIFGKNLPLVDTTISNNHAFQIKNKWYLPKYHPLLNYLDNKKTIFYHLQLEDYFNDNLMVNGLTMESWDGFSSNQSRNYQWIKLKNNSVKRILLN